jgi:hypothetical protein
MQRVSAAAISWTLTSPSMTESVITESEPIRLNQTVSVKIEAEPVMAASDGSQSCSRRGSKTGQKLVKRTAVAVDAGPAGRACQSSLIYARAHSSPRCWQGPDILIQSITDTSYQWWMMRCVWYISHRRQRLISHH